MLASVEAVAVAVVAKLIKVPTEERQVVAVGEELDSLLVMVVHKLVDVVVEVILVEQMQMKQLLEMVVVVLIMETKHMVLVVEKVDNLEKQRIVEVVLKLVVDLVEETEQQLEELQDLVLQLTTMARFRVTQLLQVSVSLQTRFLVL